jgi:hypothetical protein
MSFFHNLLHGATQVHYWLVELEKAQHSRRSKLKYPFLILALLFTSAPTSAQDDAKCSGIRSERLTLELETRFIDSEIQEIGSGNEGYLLADDEGTTLRVENIEHSLPLRETPDA